MLSRRVDFTVILYDISAVKTYQEAIRNFLLQIKQFYFKKRGRLLLDIKSRRCDGVVSFPINMLHPRMISNYGIVTVK